MILNLNGYRLQSEINEELNKIQSKYETDIQQIQEEIQKTNKRELSHWRENYLTLENAYENFASLSQKHRESIAGIFGGCDNPMDFFCDALQKGHLDQLWIILMTK